MTAFILSLGWNWLLVPVAIWFLNGLRKALTNPRIKLITHTRVGSAHSDTFIVDLRRQQLLPPWRNVHESWLVAMSRPSATREGDGRHEDGYEHKFPWPSVLANQINGALKVSLARDEEISK